MSLIDLLKEQYETVSLVAVPDEYGSQTYQLTKGASFLGALASASTREIIQAQLKQEAAYFVLYVARDTDLSYHDVIRRIRDGKVFRVTSEQETRKTPSISSLDLRTYRVEEWRIPDDATENNL